MRAARRSAVVAVCYDGEPLPQPPQGVFLDSAHTWLRITSDGRLRVGIDDFLAEAVGQVDRVEVPAQGAHEEALVPIEQSPDSGFHRVLQLQPASTPT